MLICTSMTYHLSVTSPYCQQVSTKKCSRTPTYPMILNYLINLRAVELLPTNYCRSGQSTSNEFGPRFVAPAVKLAISGFPHIVPTFPVTVQVRPASSMFRRWFFLDHQLVLRFNRVVATPITQGLSCSRLDYRKHPRGVLNLMTKSCRHGVHRFFVLVGYIRFALDGKQTKCCFICFCQS